MENSMVTVKSASNSTVVINVPDIPLHRVWKKRGAKYPIDRRALYQAYYEPSVEILFKEGLLTTDDKEFLKEVGLMDEDEVAVVTPLTDAYLARIIKLMPLNEVKREIEKLSHTQREEVADYAIEHYTDLSLDRVDILSQASGKNIMGAIENYRAAQQEV